MKFWILRKKQNQKVQRKNKQKEDFLKNLYSLFEGRESVPNVFDRKIFPIKTNGTGFSDHSNLKILSPKQMLQRLPIALAQVKTGNTSGNTSGKSYILCIEQKKLLRKYIWIQ